MVEITVVTVSYAALEDLVIVRDKLLSQYPGAFRLHLFNGEKKLPPAKKEKLNQALDASRFLILDLMGAPGELQAYLLNRAQTFRGFIVPFGGENSGIRSLLRLGRLDGSRMSGEGGEASLAKMKKMMEIGEKAASLMPIGILRDLRNYLRLLEYWRFAGEENIRNFLLLLLREYGSLTYLPRPGNPQTADPVSIMDPLTRETFPDARAYFARWGYEQGKPVIALLYYGHNYPARTGPAVHKIRTELSQIANVLPVALTSFTGREIRGLEKILQEGGERKPRLLLNLLSFRLGAGPMGGDAQAGVEFLQRLDVPVLHPFFMNRREIKEWEEAKQGINSSEFLISVMLPELDGSILTYPVGGIGRLTHQEKDDVDLKEIDIIAERVERLKKHVQSWLKLQSLPPGEKKVAIVCYNYPPGEGSIFGGAFLDTFASVANLLQYLQEGGYRTKVLTAQELREIFAPDRLVNSPRWNRDYRERGYILYPVQSFLEKYQGPVPLSRLEKEWGKAPGEVMTADGNFLLPGVVLENVFIGLQPTRGVHENPEKVYHDENLPPPYQYLAFYQWLREEFGAHVIIHVGTHGTLEFLPGKECGMSGSCFPDLCLGEIPHIYLYYAGNPAEAMVAKRRSHALLVGYQPPPFGESQLYGEYSQLEALLHEYWEARSLSPGKCEEIKELLLERARQVGIMAEDLPQLEKALYRMKRALIPLGLHIFGQGYGEEEGRHYMEYVLRYDREGQKSLSRLLAEAQGLDYEGLMESGATAQLASLAGEAQRLVQVFCREGKLPKDFGYPEEHKKEIVQALQTGFKAKEEACKNHEGQGLLKALAGCYLSAKLAGDCFKNPEIFPTGYNLYQFDPRLIPGEIACRRGALAARKTWEEYRRRHGVFPQSTAVVLWGLETSRTQGETIGQILHYLGIRFRGRKSLYQPLYEIIPLEELGRPRIDVVINICGFFRDMFPQLIHDLNNLLYELSLRDEPEEMNYFLAHTRRLQALLLEKGFSEEKARELARARIFGPQEGEYGTRVTKLLETKNWQREEQLGETFFASLRNVYSENFRGTPMPDLYARQLEAVDVVGQIRSSHEYEVTDLDHYYEFFGGLAQAVKSVKGRPPEIFITDTTGETVETEKADQAIDRGVRTRLLNPRWIEAMLKHPSRGGQEIAKRFLNILGLAATTGQVRQWVFRELHKTYVADERMRQRMKENNAFAYQDLLETMLEYDKRGYWQASEEEKSLLYQVYLEGEGDIEDGL